MIRELLTEMSAGMAAKQLKEMKESDPGKYEETVKMFLNAAELGINFLQENQEFREVFARIHTEFLKHPESKSTIEQAVQSYKKIKK